MRKERRNEVLCFANSTYEQDQEYYLTSNQWFYIYSEVYIQAIDSMVKDRSNGSDTIRALLYVCVHSGYFAKIHHTKAIYTNETTYRT